MNWTDLPQLDGNKLLAQFAYHPQAPMIFNTGFFLFLFLAFTFFYGLLRHQHRARLLYLTAFSFYFYYKSSGIFFLLLVLSTGVDFGLARWIAATDAPGRRKALVVLSVVLNLGLLAYFKYTNFFISSLNAVAGTGLPHLDIFLPVGVSFYTFQSLSYTIDVYKRELEPLRDIRDYAFFVSFFPQLVAGPIVRAADFIPQISRPLRITRADIGRAVVLICGGLFKKAVISDYISTNFVDRIFDNPLLYSGGENLLGVYGYALQIYCDFSGYSDIAIGIALLLGYRLPTNFRSPYQSTSITEFWRRWHISLSSWLRDYLYIPLGGNRKGPVRQYLNQFVTMLLGGLWHGASWQFVIWGALHGGGLAVDKLVRGGRPAPASGLGKLVGWVVTFHFVCFGWIFFRADTMATVGQVLGQIAHHFKPELLPQVVASFRGVFTLLAVGYLLHFLPDNLLETLENAASRRSVVWQAAMVASVIWLVMQVKSADIHPFIYFQF